MTSAEQRDERVEALTWKTQASNRKTLDYSDYKDFSQISEIHEDYVMCGQGYSLSGFFDLSAQEQQEQKITTYTPVALMIQSLGEQLEDRIKDVQMLKETILNANP